MKLNNKGWGTTTMIVLSIGLVLALLIAIYFIGQLYGSLDEATKNRVYADLESDLITAAKKYVINEGIYISKSEMVSYETLKDYGYIDSMKDIDGKSCDGFVRIINNGNIYDYYAYIECPNYRSKDYR